jgi:hypothetical protein
MADQWYYAHGGNKLGPFSARLFKDLADAGRILPTDTVWKEGIEKGVSAARVKNLLPRAPASSPADLSAPAPALSPLPAEAQVEAPLVEAAAKTLPAKPPPAVAAPPASAQEDQSGEKIAPGLSPEDGDQSLDEEPAPLPAPPRPQPNQPKKGRAIAAKGAVLISQDGQTVQYRKKCCKCGHEDASKNRMPIRHGLTRATFFCPKCRKLGPVEIQGMM